MAWRPAPGVVDWLSSEANPPVRYLTARDLVRPRPSSKALASLRDRIFTWEPLEQVLGLQRSDGGFASSGKTRDARPTLWALILMQRCGLNATDEPVARALDYLNRYHRSVGALSYTTGGSGVLPCYLGVAGTALIKMGALDTEMVQASIRWVLDHQRFDHRTTRAGGTEPWPYKAPQTYGCWEEVSCFHGVAGAFRMLAAIRPEHRTAEVCQRLDEALEYLRIHRLYKRTRADRPLFRHMTQSFLIGDHRADLLDMLQGIADADPELIQRDWVQGSVADMRQLAVDGRVNLVKNYGRKLIDPVPLEPVGEPSRFLTYQWTLIQRVLEAAASPTTRRGGL